MRHASHAITRHRHGILPAGCLLACLACSTPTLADTAATTFAVGVGVERMPSWAGASSHRSEPLPYVNFEWPGHVMISTLNGLQVDLIGGTVLHGGLYGNYQWGRDRSDLGALGGKIASLPPRPDLGGYLEWQLGKTVDVGGNLSHDTNGAGAYLKLYAEWDPPAAGPLQHSIELTWQAMNAPAMNRFFGISTSQASALNVQAWHPGSGSQLVTVEYDLFLPTSRSTGFALALVYGRLLGEAGGSPLVTHFGSRSQLTESLAFVYHL